MEQKTSFRKFLPSKKTALLAFFVPLVLATVTYQFIWVEDARVRSQWMNNSSLTLEQEQDRRWKDSSTWLIHALVIGCPTGLVMMILVCGAVSTVDYLSSRNKG